ncbi:putative T7SS-secreted protein [Streptomyces sp. NPDC001492]
MARPPLADWESVFGFSSDPTPGDPEVLERLASEYRSISNDALSAHSVVARLDSDELGEGKSMEALRTQLKELPTQVGKLQSSYEAAADAIAKYAIGLRETQDQADRALERGREAKQRLDSAIEVASAASAHVKSLDSAEPPPPDDEAAKSNARRALADAKEAESSAAQSVESAQAELEAARLLALDAQELRTSDAGVAKRELEEAEGEAVKGKSFWDKIGDILNQVFSIIGTVLGVIAMFVAGPIGVALAIGAVIFGAASLGLTIAKGADTGHWDIVGIVLGVVGLAAGGIAVFAGKGIGALGKVGLGDWIKNLFKRFYPTEIFATAPVLELDLLGGGASVIVPETVVVGGRPALSTLDGILNGLGLITGIAGLIYGPLEFTGHAPGGGVDA